MLEGGAQLGEPLVGVDDLLPRHVAAPLGPDLVLEEDADGSGLLPEFDGASDVDGVAVAGVGVDDQPEPGRGEGDAPGDIGDLGLGEQPDVGPAEMGPGDGEPRDEAELEPGLLSQEGRPGVPDPGEQHGLAGAEPGSEPVGSIVVLRRHLSTPLTA